MSENQPVILEGIPVFTGNLALLDTKVTSLTKDGEKISSAAADIHSSFGGLQAFYKAPEADQLFATTKPVADRGASLKSDLATITSALSSYSDDAHPLVEKLKRLKRDAGAFLVKVNADDKWREDGDLVEENNNRRAEIAETWAAFQAVERACHNKIISLVPDGKQLTLDDGSGGKGMYGYDAEALKHAKGLPWGDPVKESTRWFQVWEHAWDFGKGVVVDGVWGTIKGLGTLVGTDGWESMKQAWTGLAKLTTGVIISTTPLAAAFWLTPEDKLPSWLRDSRTAMKETGKALLAWDQWSENPARAAGAVTFNVVTTVFTGGTGGAVAGGGKAALAAKALSFAGKAGRVIDPMTYLFKGAGAGLTKISDVMAGLKGMGNIEVPTLPSGTVTLPDGGFKLADGTLHLPEGAAIPDGAFEVPKGAVKLPEGMDIPAGAVDLGDGVVRLPEGMTPPAGSLPIPEGALKLPEGTAALPEGTVRGTDKDGNIVHLDREGNILKEDGTLKQHHSAAPDGNPTDGAPIRTDADTPLPRTPAEESALVGAGARTGGGDSIRLGSDFSDTGRLGDDAARTGDDVGHSGPAGQVSSGGLGDSPPPGGHADSLSHGPSASHEPLTGNHSDGPGGGSSHDGPAGSDGMVGDGGHVPGGSGSDVPPISHGDGFGGPGVVGSDGPGGNLPDGSWSGENGLRLDREANAAADDFMRRSAVAEPRITESMQGIAGRVDDGRLIGLEYRLKGDDSLKRKLATDLLEDSAVAPSRALADIKDSIRYTMEIPGRSYTQGVRQAINDLQAKGFENITFKNTWDSAGYKGINSTWRDPVSGQIFELQFHTADSFVAKMDGHALYEKERLPGNSPDELAAIRTEQSELFGKVPVPRDAGAIRLGAHGADDLATSFGKDVAPAPGELPSVADDAGGLTDGAGGRADDAPEGTEPTYTDGPGGGWGGAGWVEKPSDYAAGIYDSLRATPNHIDIPVMSRNTGIDESVLRQVKSHMMRSQHDVVIQPGEWKRGRFTPRDDIADLWDGARKGTLNEAQIKEFRNLMTHEYVESRLMKAGLPYLHDQAGLWRREPDGTYAGGGRYSPKSLSAAGAHDLAPNPVRGGFGTAWQKLGLKHPKTKLAADLSNLDDFVKDVFQELRDKGLELK
ncbi:hypothetical protein ACIPMU_08080 [Streptomyces cyaneofuscatus]|uniref:hypothetical protein n=1 Tax=Streptomyces cyaneofuscatus TaxID=66883 RepID=UPI003817553C